MLLSRMLSHAVNRKISGPLQLPREALPRGITTLYNTILGDTHTCAPITTKAARAPAL